MNTRIEYMYRDGENYKEFGTVVVSGEVALVELRPFLCRGEFFVPSEVGLEDLQTTPYLNCDHVWHELESTTITSEAPTVDVDAEELVARFRVASESNWETPTVASRMREIDGW